LTVPAASSTQDWLPPVPARDTPPAPDESDAAAGTTASIANEIAIERVKIQARENDGWLTGVALLVP
jgi:hypothetical protein